MIRSSNRLRTLALLSPFALALVAAACGNKENTNPDASGGAANGNSGGSGSGSAAGSGGANVASGGGPASGGTTGDSGGASGNSGGSANPGSGGGQGSGGDGGTDFAGVPGAQGFDCTPASGDVPALKATAVVTSGLTEAMHVAYEPGGDAKRLFVLERGGVLRVIQDGALVSTPFLDFSSKAVAGMAGGDERGALGFAFHPQYATNGLFYVHYSDAADSNDSGDSIIEEYKVSSDPNVADVGSARLVLKVEQPLHGGTLKNHKGGAINFGLDGYLYIGFGDGGGSGDPSGNGQSVTTLLGKILRINPVKSGDNAYTSPAGNLKDTMASALPEIWDYGVRNPFRSSFDGCTGDFYIGEVGQGAWEEVDIEKVGEGGKNYGWNTMEGTHCYSPMSQCVQTGITMPVLDYDHQTGTSVTGGAVYRGRSIPGLRGAYFYADHVAGKVWMTVYDRAAGTISTPVSLTQDLSNVSQIVSIANGADGELYLVSLMSGVYKLESAQ